MQPYLGIRSLRYDHVKIRSYWIRMGPDPLTVVPIKRQRAFGCRAVHKGGGHKDRYGETRVKIEADSGVMCLKGQDSGGSQQTTRYWEKAGNRFSSQPQEEPLLPKS